MESFHFSNSSDNQGSQESFDLMSENYEFPHDLTDIPHPDESYMETENSSQSADQDCEIELPLPPGSMDIELPPIGFKNVSSPQPSINKLPPHLSTGEFEHLSAENIPMPKSNSDKTILNVPPLEENYKEKISNDVIKTTATDDSKYSPSKAESDEEMQDFTAVKPKVLGKEQAKKRLMAFSLSKQPNAGVKKQNKVLTPAKNKEKPPNPNKGSGVQEQFRATISAIEEEKRKMMQNMPHYLLMEMNELSKSTHSGVASSLHLLEKQKSELGSSQTTSGKDDKSSETKNKEASKKSTRRSPSQSRSKRQRRSRSRRRSSSRGRRSRRQSRSTSRSKSRSRSRRRSRSKSKRSHSRSRRSQSHTRKTKEDKNKSDKKESGADSKESLEDWGSFKAAGLFLENNQTKNRFDELPGRRDQEQRRSGSPKDLSEFKPIFNYLKKRCKIMKRLEAKPASPGKSSPILFLEKTVKYTRTKPIISWAENPSLATEFYMSKQMLLENCDQASESILRSIMENIKDKSLPGADDSLEIIPLKSRPWYPREEYLLPVSSSLYDSLEVDKSHFKMSSGRNDKGSAKGTVAEPKVENSEGDLKFDNKDRKRKRSPERKLSLVNDSYLSDEEAKVKEMTVGDVKVHVDLDLNRLKVRSRWDSDYEGEEKEKEKESESLKGDALEITRNEKKPQKWSNENLLGDVKPGFQMTDDSPKKTKVQSPNFSSSCLPQTEARTLEKSPAVSTGNLVSEYEEFLKMVSFDSNNVNSNKTEEVLSTALCTDFKLEKQKAKITEKSTEEEPHKNSKIGLTDWDQESDEDKSIMKKIPFSKSDPHDEFLLLKEEKVDVKKKKNKKNLLKKKAEKLKPKKKKKVLKKSGKGKKDKYEDSSSDDSSSESESDSDESRSSKKKKKKISKAKKRSKRDSSSETESDSDDSKSKKKKHKKKKGGKKKKDPSSDSEEEIQNALLKQLDFKKQLIMKKIEEIDSISERSGKKKNKENKVKKKGEDSSEEGDLIEKYGKWGKKKKPEEIKEKDKKKAKYSGKKNTPPRKGSKESRRNKSSSESDSDSDSSESSGKKKKAKKEPKRKRHSSESSDSEEKTSKGSKSQGKLKSLKSSSYKKTKKVKKEKKKKKESSSDSDSEDYSGNENKKSKKSENKMKGDEDKDEASRSSWKENLLIEGPEFKGAESRLSWGGRKLWKKSERRSKKKKDEDDWEASSSLEESSEECKTRESSWDDEGGSRAQTTKPSVSKTEETCQKDGKVLTEKLTENVVNISETKSQPVPDTLKTSLSNFSFNENSFCSFGQELSRDFFLTEHSVSNTAQGGVDSGKTLRTDLIEPRPFQSVSRDSEVKKPADSELYSPGYSDSDLSDTEGNKSEKVSNSNAGSGLKADVYDPLNCESEGSSENNDVKLSNIPLPFASGVVHPGGTTDLSASPNADNKMGKGFVQIETETNSNLPSSTTPLISSFTSTDFMPVAASHCETGTPTKKQVISVKGQQKLKSKAASVFQDESDDGGSESLDKTKPGDTVQNEIPEYLKEKTSENISESKHKEPEKDKDKIRSGKKDKENRERSRERSREREGRKRRSVSRERRDGVRFSGSTSSPRNRKKSKTPEISKSKEKREIQSDSFEIEPLKGSNDSFEVEESVRPIPVLTGLGVSSDRVWSRSHLPGYTCSEFSNNLVDHAESFDIYPSEDSKLRNRLFEKDYMDQDKKSSSEKSHREERSKKEARKSRSRSLSPRKKRRSKSPERRKSPRRRSASPKRREKSPFSPRRRSPKRKSPSRRGRSSRSPDRRRKSRSRSPRKRRSSPSRRSRSLSPRKYRSPKRRGDSPRRKDSPSRTFSPKEFSPRRNPHYSHPYPPNLHNRIPVIGASGEDMKLSPSSVLSPRFESFPRHLPESAMGDSEISSSFYDREYQGEFGAANYPEDISVNNLITVKNHDIEKPNSPERLSLDQRIELELGVQLKSGSEDQNEQYQFQDINPNHFQNSYNCDSTATNNDTFYQNQGMHLNPEFNGQYFNGHQQPPNYGSFQQYPNPQPVQSSVLQVGNIVEVVPTLQHPPPPPPPHSSKPHQIMQVGNVLQVVPSPKTAQPAGVVPTAHNYGPSASPTVPLVKTQKATAVVAPSSIVPTPNPDAIINPLVKAIQLEREKRRKEKEKRKAEREARRKARQLRREAKLMSVNEKLKKSVQDEGLMLGQEVEDEELLDGLDVPSPPIPVEIITVSSHGTLPPAGKGILITAGFIPKPPSEKKEVKFADGVCPGEGTSTSGGEDIASPPPKPKLPKEKRYKKKKTKVKKKVKVQIIRQIIQDEDDDDDDDLSPPPPPPGDPPPVFFARFPFAGDAQFPVYQTQTTTTTLTTVQYPAQLFNNQSGN